MTTTTIDLHAIEPLDRSRAVELGRVEYRRMVDELAQLDGQDWARPTDCDGWTVRDLAGHLAGAMTSAASFGALVREQRAVARRARRTGESKVDAMTAVQVEANAGLNTVELVTRMRGLVDAAADGRRRMPAPLARFLRTRVRMGAIDETWRLDYLLGTILTRDVWLHRCADLAHALGRAPRLDAGHDGRIVADVAAEWARRHGEPVELVLTGPAGGRYVSGAGGPTIELDAVELCRILSGRAAATHPLLSTEVPF